MPKLKTHKGAAKRFKKTATGKVKRGQAKTRHILTSKEKKSKRKLGKSALVSDGDLRKVLRMIPYYKLYPVFPCALCGWRGGEHKGGKSVFPPGA